MSAVDSSTPTETLTLTGTTSTLCEYVLDFERDPDADDSVAFAIEPGGEADTFDHEYEDTVTETATGYRVHGWVGNGGTDDFYVDAGQLVAGAFHAGSADVTLGDAPVDVAALPDPDDSPGTPGAPTNLRVTSRGATSISLAWDHPGNVVDFYRVYVDGTPYTTVPRTDATLSGLTQATAYEVAVSAVNERDT